MVITKIDVVLIEDKPEDNPAWSPIVCRVYTDEGIYGDGEAALSYGFPSRGAFGALQDFAKLVIGRDPLRNERIWEDLYRNTFWGQNGGPVVFAAISAIDVALWDIKGKFFNVPVYQLLGGKCHDKLRCYASQLQFGWGVRKTPAYTIDEYVANARTALDEGYDAVKYDFFTYDEEGRQFTYQQTNGLLSPSLIDLVVRRVAAVREAVGPNVDIIMENHATIDAQGAIQLGKLVEPYNLLCYEEPCTPTPRLTKLVHDNVRIPISQGERVYSRWQYAEYFANGSVQLIQPDLGNCGGLTEGKKIADMAHAFDVGVQVHVCSSPLLTAAALQLECAIPNFAIHEHHVYNRYDYNKRLCKFDYQPENGYFSIPDLPGIGNELSDYVFEHGQVVTVE